MPSATVFQVDSETGERKPVSSYSYKKGETFADARHKLAAHFQFDFQFIDVNLSSRMLESWEAVNSLEDCGGKVIVIPKDPNCVVHWPVQSRVVMSEQLLGSSNASNGPNITASDDRGPDMTASDDHAASPVMDEPPIDQSAPQGPSEEPQISLGSELMTNELKRTWSSCIEKFKDHMESIQCSHHKWRVKTWDKDNVPYGHIECCECCTRHDGSSKGVMDKMSINNAFTNFKKKHLISSKHAARVASNRGERLHSKEVARRAQANTLSDRAILDQHVKIVQKVNASQTVGRETFTILGDVDREPLELYKFKLLCNFCSEHLVLIPKQRNLEPNLESHCNSISHLNCVTRSQQPARGDPVLSGRPGRPRQADARDVKQRTIQGFLTRRPSGGQSSSSSRVSTAEERGAHLSLLCWGLWRDVVKYGSETRPIKGILNDQVKLEGQWFAEPLVVEDVFSVTGQETYHIAGLFRHKNCSRLSRLGGGFEDLTCEHCFSIKGELDFRLRVAREFKASEKRGSRGTGKGRRLDYLTVPEVQQQAKCYRNQVLRERKLQRILSHKLLMARARVPPIGEVCLNYQEPNKATVLKFCQSIVLAHRRGAFGGRGALWDMLSDIASNLNKDKKGYRYKAGTKLLCQTLFLHGGRRVVDCLASNGIGPSLNTLQRDRRGMAVFRAGIHASQFKFMARVYSQLKERLGISCPIPCFMAEDETVVKKTVRWMPKHDTLIGFCGKQSEGHQCVSGLEVKVGEGEVGFTTIVDLFANFRVGNLARVIMLNPLVVGLPHLVVMADITCNKFDAPWVRRQWEKLENLWNIHCLEAVGPLLGHASDGDSRRRKLMLEDYSGRGIQGLRQHLGWEGWQLTHSFAASAHNFGDQCRAYAVGLHDQDFIHNGKKLINPLDSSARILKLGAGVATISHLIHLEELYEVNQHGLNKEDIRRRDRQNWASAQRLCSRKVSRSLRMLRDRADARVELTLGTEVYTRICADYLDIFLNTRLTLRERIVLCGKVGFFFRLWRLWCFHGNHSVGGNTHPVTFTHSCIPMQTFLDIQMSVHFVVLLIIQFRENFPHLPVPLHLTGSDSCEQFFSKVGGMKGNERSYDISELVECATNLNRLAAMDLSDGIMGVGKSHKKHSNIWMALHPLEIGVDVVADQANYTGIETNADIIIGLQEGLVLAQSIATECEMNPSTSARDKLWWTSPWTIEAKGARFGGWCDVNVESLVDVDDNLDGDPRPVVNPVIEVGLTHQEISEEITMFADPEVVEAGAAIEVTMDAMHSDLVYGAPIQEFKPIVAWNEKSIYKSTLVSQLVGNPHLSKDRLTRVKQSIYFNNLVDKPNVREGSPTMFMTVGSDCGVFFVDDTPPIRPTRNTESIARALKGKGRGKKSTEPKRPRGEAVTVTSVTGVKYKWWIGRVQSIHRKYGNTVGRSREALDLLDRPGPEACCEVRFNWFTPIGASGCKFKYDMCDPSSISLEAIISTVSFTVDPLHPKVFILHPDDVLALDDFVKNRIV